jgi:hypothetical protein
MGVADEMCALVAATLATGPEVAAMRLRRLGRTGLKVSVIGVGPGSWVVSGAALHPTDSIDAGSSAGGRL